LIVSRTLGSQCAMRQVDDGPAPQRIKGRLPD
jgi:hypothetical protein